MVATEASKIRRFVIGLHPNLVAMVDIERDEPELYTEAIECLIF